MMADLDRIKRNVARMVDQNAPVSDINAYIAAEGVTVEQVRAHKLGEASSSTQAPAGNEPANAWGDAAYQLSTGFNRGLMGLIDAPTHLANAGLDLAGSDFRFGSPVEAVAPDLHDWMTREPEAQTAAGEVAGTVGEYVGANAIPGMGAIAAAPRIAAATQAATGLLGQTINHGARSIAAAPGVAAGGELVSSVGAGLGAQLGRDIGGPQGEFIGAMLGGIGAPAALFLSPTNLARRGIGAVASRVSPRAMERRGRDQVRQSLQQNLTPEAEARILEASQLQETIPGYRPSVAEATESPSFIRTQQEFEAGLSGPELDAARRRYQHNETAVAQAQSDMAPQSALTPDDVFAAQQRRIARARGGIDRGLENLDGRSRALGETIRPGQRRRDIGGGLREQLTAERARTKEELSLTAREMGLNSNLQQFDFTPIRDRLIAAAKPRSALEDRAALPSDVIADIRSFGDEIGIVDLMALRSRITDSIREQQRLPTGEKKVPYLKALLGELDASADAALRGAGATELADNWAEFRRIYHDDLILPFEQGAAGNILKKDATGAYRIPDEQVATEFFNGWNQTAADQFAKTFKNAPGAHAAMEAAAMDNLFHSAVIDGVIDPAKLAQWSRRHQGVIGAFPGVQRKLGSIEAAVASLSRRRAVLIGRQDMIERSYLAREVARIENPISMATPEAVIDQAIRNPARMKRLMQALKSQEARDAIARQVWNDALASPNPTEFLKRNGLSLKYALGDRYDVALRLARAIEKNALVPRPGGQAMDTNPVAAVENVLGTGLNQISSRVFAAKSGRTSTRWVLTDLAGRAFRAMSADAARKTLQRAIYDPQIAIDLANAIEGRMMSEPAAKRLYTFLISNGLLAVENRVDQREAA